MTQIPFEVNYDFQLTPFDPTVSVSDREPAARKSGSETEILSQENVSSNVADIVYPSGMRLTVITVCLCLGIFMVALDRTVIAVAMYTFLTLFISDR
jgi:hypothetical protein